MLATGKHRHEARVPVFITPHQAAVLIKVGFQALTTRGGAKKGAAARNAALTDKQKSKIAKKAARARWNKQ